MPKNYKKLRNSFKKNLRLQFKIIANKFQHLNMKQSNFNKYISKGKKFGKKEAKKFWNYFKKENQKSKTLKLYSHSKLSYSKKIS